MWLNKKKSSPRHQKMARKMGENFKNAQKVAKNSH